MASDVSAAEVQQEVEKILKSEHFRSSEKLSRFLQYICRKHVEGTAGELNEYLLGLEVFDRKPGFSPSEDSIVRVRAHELRRRLREYYAAERQASRIRITLPKGHYAPEFTRVVTGAPGSPAIAPLDTEPEQRTPATPSMAGESRRPLLAGRGPSHGMVNARELYDFYDQLLGELHERDPQLTLINLSNPKVMFSFACSSPSPPGYLGRPSIPIAPQLAKHLPINTNDVALPFATSNALYHFLHPTDDEYTGMGEAVCAFHLGRLLQILDRPVHITQARFLTWDKASRDNLIVLGLPVMNAWVEANLAAPNFRFVSACWHNSQPQPGEEQTYRCELEAVSKETGFTDYGIIFMQPLPNGNRVLLLAAASSYGTLGLGEFFCNPDRMRPVYEMLKKRATNLPFPSTYEVLIKIQIRDNLPIATSVVACR
ncbi:MAG: hypothetical protein EHM23_14010 [Acidobacteria bacterium]|nr:MAG: hypothetical protein EHM23_14010 [Acidobacteriota bacterium]